MWKNKKHHIIAINLIGSCTIEVHTLHASTPFIGKGPHPKGGVWTMEEGVDVLGATCTWVVHFSSNHWIVLNGLKEVTSERVNIEALADKGSPWLLLQNRNRHGFGS
jgi:hypothetical protein